jgi:DNA-binding transcriptional MerR regulator
VGKIPRKFFKIGEVMEHTGFSRQTLHNYTVLGLLRVARRTPAGHRLYDEEVFERLERIRELKKTNTLEEIRRILGEGETPPPDPS